MGLQVVKIWDLDPPLPPLNMENTSRNVNYRMSGTLTSFNPPSRTVPFFLAHCIDKRKPCVQYVCNTLCICVCHPRITTPSLKGSQNIAVLTNQADQAINHMPPFGKLAFSYMYSLVTHNNKPRPTQRWEGKCPFIKPEKEAIRGNVEGRKSQSREIEATDRAMW